MDQRITRTASRSFALFLFASSAAAQWSWSTSPDPVPAPSGGPYGQGAYDRVLAGDVTGDGVEDVVVLRGNRAALLHGPGAYVASAPFLISPLFGGLPENVEDLALFRRAGADYSAAVLTTGSAGLVLWDWDDSAGELVPTPVSGSWTSAGEVAVWKKPGTALTYIAVHDSADGDIEVSVWIEGGGVFAGNVASVATGGTVRDLALFDWDGDGAPEVAAFHANGVVTYALDGTVLAGIPEWTPGGRMAVWTGAPNDRLLFVTPDTSATMHWAYTLDVGGLLGPVDVGLPGVAGVSAAGPNGTEPSVLQVLGTDGSLRHFHDLGFGVPLSTEEGSLLVFPAATLDASQSAVGLADLDHDGDREVLAADGGTSTLDVYDNVSGDPDELLMFISLADFTVDGSTGEIDLELELAPPFGTPAPTPNKIEILAWPWDLPPGGDVEDGELLGQADGYLYEDLADPAAGFADTLEIGGAYDVYILEIRMVVDQPGEPRYAFPSEFVGFTTVPALYEDLTGGSTGPGGPVQGFQPGADPELRGGIVPLLNPPPFMDGDVPMGG